jgi:CHAT domain-containing protein/Tfp pilus assembly protein PilF
VLLAAGCAVRKPEQPDTIHRSAQQELRNGNLESALRLAERGLALEHGRLRTGEWHSRLLLLKAEILIATGKREEGSRILDGFQPSGANAKELLARRKMNQGYARVRSENPRGSLRLLDEARALAVEAASDGLIAEVENRRGEALARLHETQAAETSFRTALENARRAVDRYQEMAALGNLGMLRVFDQRYDEAIPWFEQVLPLAEQAGYRRFVAKTTHNIGICDMMLGDGDRALKLLSAAEELYRRNEDPVGRQGCLGDLGIVYFARRDYPSALSCYRRARDLARQQKDRLYEAEWLNRLATCSLEAGNLNSAEDFNRQARAMLAEIQESRRTVDLVLTSARIAAGRGLVTDAESLYADVIRRAEGGVPTTLLEAHARLGSLFARAGQWDKAERQFQTLGAVIEQTRSRLGRVDWKLTFQSSLVPFYDDYVELLVERGREAKALEAAESCRAQVLAEKLSLSRKAAPRPDRLSLPAASRLGRDTVVLYYWVAPKRSFLWVVTSGRTSTFGLPPEDEMARLVNAYSRVIQNLEDPASAGNPAGERLYNALVAPATELIPAGANVVLIPDGPLHRLNFEALPVPGERPRYWIEDVTVTVAPSLEVLAQGAAAGRPEERSLLLLGDPVPPGPEFPPLPNAAVEISNIQGRFPPNRRTVLTGDSASPPAYQAARPDRFSFVHFSAHAVANVESPLDSAVILSRKGDSFKLYAREVAAVPLRARLVTISACRSAGERFYSGEGLIGFAWAFLQAGAGNVIAGLWDVNDRSTSLLMSGLYERLTKGTRAQTALRAAKLEFLKNPVYRKPYYWAPFVLFTRTG